MRSKQLVCRSDALECAVVNGVLLAVEHGKCSHTHNCDGSAEAGREACVKVFAIGGVAGSLAGEQGCRLGQVELHAVEDWAVGVRRIFEGDLNSVKCGCVRCSVARVNSDVNILAGRDCRAFLLPRPQDIAASLKALHANLPIIPVSGRRPTHVDVEVEVSPATRVRGPLAVWEVRLANIGPGGSDLVCELLEHDLVAEAIVIQGGSTETSIRHVPIALVIEEYDG